MYVCICINYLTYIIGIIDKYVLKNGKLYP